MDQSLCGLPSSGLNVLKVLVVCHVNPLKELLFVDWDAGGGSLGSVSVCTALVVVRWRASWDFVLLAMLSYPSSDDCVEDFTSVSTSEGGTTRAREMLDCSLLNCVAD